VRPKTIVFFEWIILGTILLTFLQICLIWDRIIALQGAIFVIIQIFIFLLGGTLTLLVSRRRNKIAMWVLIAWFALALVSNLAADVTNGRVDIINLPFLIVQGLAYGLLFTPSARRWMNRDGEKNEKLREVFG
jgi:hypothetical protein